MPPRIILRLHILQKSGEEPFVTLRYFGPEVWPDKDYPNVSDWKKQAAGRA